ncbi:DUF6476 family protein [Paracoccus endophyticus]|uniref:DUF6476 family protein n=1 Tax=Paracoccus endophyticus TaxID=2233774 RepID=UPI0013A69BB2|nr:DUF6476 family protein [Paracoccus endophyticus]
MAPDDNDTAAAAKVPELALLRRVVVGLALAMGLGIAAIAAILWLRLSQPPLPVLPAAITLPAGARAAAVTFARDWTVVVTDAGAILLYDRAGTLRQSVVPDA